MPLDTVPKTWTPHLRIQWSGTLGTPPLEIWSNTLNYTFESGYTPTKPDVQLMADAIGPLVANWFIDTDSYIHEVAALDVVKVNWILATGKQRDATIQHEFSPMPTGSNTGPVPPWEVTYCLTERTALRRGRGHSGRIFPPVTAVAIGGGSPYITEADASAMAGSFAGLCSAIRDALKTAPAVKPVAPALSVLSPGQTGGTYPDPTFQHVTGISVDRVADIQHRRTNRVPRAEVPAVPLAPLA